MMRWTGAVSSSDVTACGSLRSLINGVKLPHVPVCVQHGACVNAMDLWQFTPLHEAASKNRVEVQYEAFLILMTAGWGGGSGL